MAYNQVLQSTIEGVKSIARTDICIFDPDGSVIAATCNEGGQYRDSVVNFANSQWRRSRLCRDTSILKYLTEIIWIMLC